MRLTTTTLSMLGAAALLILTGCAQMIPQPIHDKPAPSLTIDQLMQAPHGAKADWGHLQGKVVVLQFWAPWAKDSTRVLAHLNGLATTFQNDPVQFIWVTPASQEEVEKFLQAAPINGWIGLDPDRSTFKDYQFGEYPYTVVLSQEGRVSYVTKPHLITENLIRDLLIHGKRPLRR